MKTSMKIKMKVSMEILMKALKRMGYLEQGAECSEEGLRVHVAPLLRRQKHPEMMRGGDEGEETGGG